jgi:para-aminobenzoate synthetase / 4-amino-4-deoxychorismate lyase
LHSYYPLPLQDLLPLLSGSDNWVLLDSALPGRENCRSYLFLDPLRVLIAREYDEVPGLLADLEQAGRDGLWAAGALSYEAAFGIEGSLDLADVPEPDTHLAWFGLYSRPLVFDHAGGEWLGGALPGSAGTMCTGDWSIAGLKMDTGCEMFTADVEKIKKLIAAGRTYQVNYTRRWNFTFSGDELGLYLACRRAQPVPFAAMIRSGGWRVLSMSPELFFRTDGRGNIVARPMKGTASRGRDIREDYRCAKTLRADPKNRAENLMIVDLLRNDLGRVCRTGTVSVPRLFEIERYRSLLQMTSTVTGELAGPVGVANIIGNIFPCGSITGAPKISTMKIIAALEDTARGVYTGAIGYTAPGGESCFNVAIRTLELDGGRGVMGTGCGIVADSNGPGEYEECRLKARFLTGLKREPKEFQLIETMLAINGAVDLIEYHLDRMGTSARYFGMAFSRRDARLALAGEIGGRHARLKVRLLLDSGGRFTAESKSVEQVFGPVNVALWPDPINADSSRSRHKTTDRELYNRAWNQASGQGLFDYLFINERGFLAEGSICNIYIERAGVLYTPPVRAGALPGVYRRHLKASSETPVRERNLTPEDILTAERLWVSNAVTGLVVAELVDS